MAKKRRLNIFKNKNDCNDCEILNDIYKKLNQRDIDDKQYRKEQLLKEENFRKKMLTIQKQSSDEQIELTKSLLDSLDGLNKEVIAEAKRDLKRKSLIIDNIIKKQDTKIEDHEKRIDIIEQKIGIKKKT